MCLLDLTRERSTPLGIFSVHVGGAGSGYVLGFDPNPHANFSRFVGEDLTRNFGGVVAWVDSANPWNCEDFSPLQSLWISSFRAASSKSSHAVLVTRPTSIKAPIWYDILVSQCILGRTSTHSHIKSNHLQPLTISGVLKLQTLVDCSNSSKIHGCMLQSLFRTVPTI